MSAGAVFKLIANDGKADRMITANRLLNQRIRDIMCARRSAGLTDLTPQLTDLERTHLLYFNAHFKPYAAVGFEYNKVRPSSGSLNTGSTVTYSIPQFGDFFHDIVVRTTLGQTQSSILLTPLQGLGTPSNPALFPPNGQNADGTTTADAEGYLGTFKYYNLVDAFGRRLVTGQNIVSSVLTPLAQVQYRNLVRYCEYPAERFFRNVQFSVNGNPLDEYDSSVPMFLRKACLAPNKVDGYKRLSGQEVEVAGTGRLVSSAVVDGDRSTAGTANTPAVLPSSGGLGDSLFNNPPPGGFAVPASYTTASPSWFGGISTTFGTFNNSNGVVPFAGINSTPAPIVDVARERKQYLNGLQTPKWAQPQVELWNKLRFWFNDDVRLAVPSVSIPFGQRFITIAMAPHTDLVYEFPNLYLETIIEVPGTIATSTLAPSTTAMSFATPYQRIVRYSPIFLKGTPSAPAILSQEMYVNNIFVNAEIHDIYIRRIGFSLIRVYRIQNARVATDGSGEMLLSNIKWPVEYIFAALQPSYNTRDTVSGANSVATGGNENVCRDWHALTRLIDVPVTTESRAQVPANAFYNVLNLGAFNTTPSLSMAPGATSSIGQVVKDTYTMSINTVDSMSVFSHGISIFEAFSHIFFNSYLPFHYGGAALNTPNDRGLMFVNFALFPRSYNPSGYINISRARETYLRWTTSYVSSSTPAEVKAVAHAINFLLITDGSALLRYNT